MTIRQFSRLFVFVLSGMALFSAPAMAGEPTNIEPAKANIEPTVSSWHGRTLWKWSLVAYGAANALDIGSSYGPHQGHERNSLLTDANGNFRTAKALEIKLPMVAATAIAEYLVIRKWPHAAKLFSVVNFGWSTAETAVAIHNFGLKN